MALAPWRSDAVDVLAADGPGVDDQRAEGPLTSTVSMRMARFKGWSTVIARAV